MSRAAETYRGVRRNMCMHEPGGRLWGPAWYYDGHSRSSSRRVWPADAHLVRSRAEMRRGITEYKPHQGERERVRRVRQMAEGKLMTS